MVARGQFREALDLLRVDVDELGRLAQRAVASALGALLGEDPHLAGAVVAGDDVIDALFVDLEERAYGLVAQQAPVAADLRFLMSSLRVMSDFEKIGDRAVAMAKSARADWEREPQALALIGRMGDLALHALASAREAWSTADLAAAGDLQTGDEVMDACLRGLVAHLLTREGAGAPSLVLHGHAVGRNLERIADHAVIIGERVRYMATGDLGALAKEAR